MSEPAGPTPPHPTPTGSAGMDPTDPVPPAEPATAPPASELSALGLAAEWRPAAVIVGGLVLLGVGQGVVWSIVAPGQQAKVFANGAYLPLPTADYHPFVALAIFVLAGLAVGLVAAVAAWRVRAIRGSVTLLALFVGASAGAAVAFGIGLLLASGVDPASIGATGHESLVTAAPRLATPLALVAEPLAAVAVYTFLAAWDSRPDLGRLRPSEEARNSLLP